MSVEHVVSFDRRSFMKVATGVITGVIAATSPLAALVPSRAWAVDLGALTDAQGAALLAMIRTIAPHDALDSAAYALVVAALDKDAAASAAVKSDLLTGITTLGVGFAQSPESDRVAQLKAIESSAFFQGVRVKTLLVLYNNPIAFAHFGYEGEAFSKGGYLFRGFNDLKWLPEVPLADSGPMPV